MKSILLFLLISISCSAQIKIGDITISDSLAKEYFLDCYKHPDTLYFDHSTGLHHISQEEEDLEEYARKNAVHRNDQNGMLIYMIPRKPSDSDFADFMRRKYKVKK